MNLDRPLSPTRLARFRRSELLFLIDEKQKRDTEDRRIGRAAHALVLEGRKVYDSRYTLDGPINTKTGKPFGRDTQCGTNFEEKTGKTVITAEMSEAVEGMAKGVAAHHWASCLLSLGQPEVEIRADYCGLPCVGRVDFLPQPGGLVDFKTCHDLDEFEGDCRRHDYTYQMAFYRALLANHTRRLPQDIEVFIIGAEKEIPYRAGVWRIGQGVLGIAQQENERAIARLKCCLALNQWRSGYEEVRSFDWF